MNIIPTHPEANSYLSVEYADEYLLAKSNYSDWESLSVQDKERQLIRATRQIDLLPYSSISMYWQPMDYRLEQKLKFPLWIDGGYSTRQRAINKTAFTSNSVTAPQLIGQISEPTGYWNDGALIITEGTGRGDTYHIDTFNGNTGVVTIKGTFESIDNTSRIKLVYKVIDDVKRATAEQAIYLINYTENPLVRDGIKSAKADDVSETYERPMGSLLNGVSYSIETLSLLEPYIGITSRMQT